MRSLPVPLLERKLTQRQCLVMLAACLAAPWLVVVTVAVAAVELTLWRNYD